MGGCLSTQPTDARAQRPPAYVLGVDASLTDVLSCPTCTMAPSFASSNTCKGIVEVIVQLHETGLVFAALFVGIQGIQGSTAAKNACGTALHTLLSQELEGAVALEAMMQSVHSTLLQMKVQNARATGVAVLFDVKQQTLAVANVGCNHVVLAEVVGSFSQATSLAVPLTASDMGDIRNLLQAYQAQPQDPALLAAAAPHMLGGAPGVPLHVQVHTHPFQAPSPQILLVTEATAALASLPDLADLSHAFAPGGVQLFRDAAAAAPAAPALTPPSNLCQGVAPGASCPALAPPSTALQKNTPGGIPVVSHPASHPAPAGQAGLPASPPCASDFNLAALLMHWALFAQPRYGLGHPRRRGFPQGAPRDAAVLALTIEWPQTLTTQQVELMKAARLLRAHNARATYHWYMAQQLVRSLIAHRRRARCAWYELTSQACMAQLRERRAAEVLAWKHLGEAVQVNHGGLVHRTMVSTPLTPPFTPATLGPAPITRPGQDTSVPHRVSASEHPVNLHNLSQTALVSISPVKHTPWRVKGSTAAGQARAPPPPSALCHGQAVGVGAPSSASTSMSNPAPRPAAPTVGVPPSLKQKSGQQAGGVGHVSSALDKPLTADGVILGMVEGTVPPQGAAVVIAVQRPSIPKSSDQQQEVAASGPPAKKLHGSSRVGPQAHSLRKAAK